MLGKLLKYEFKATGRILLPIFGATLIVSIVNALMPNRIYASYSELEMVTKSIAALLLIAFFFASVGLSFLVSVLRFKKNILGNEGYLMNTIPVGPMQNVTAKLIVAVLYQVVGIFVGMLSVELSGGFGDFIEGLQSFAESVISTSPRILLENAMAYIFLLLGVVIFNVAVYASLSVGHSFNGAKLIKSIGVFLVLFIAGSVIASLISFSFVPSGFFTSYALIYGIEIAYIAIGLVITNFFLKYRLNLE